MLKSRFHSKKWRLSCLIWVVSVQLISVKAKDCLKRDQCSCGFDDGSGTVDLSKIGSQSGDPLIKDQAASDNYAYSFNPCYGFNEGTCTNVAGCQVNQKDVTYFDIGAASKVWFSFDGLNVKGTYIADDNARTSVVTYICDPAVDPPKTKVLGETSFAVYEFEITSKYACPTPGPVLNETCTQLDQCSCRFNDGRGLVDLSTLGKHGSPLIMNSKSGLYYYSFNPCFPFDEGTCTDVAGCQLENATGIYIDIGSVLKVDLSYDGSNIVGNYTSSDGSRRTIVTYVCDPAVQPPITITNGEVALRTYGFTIISKEICPKKELLFQSNASD